MCVKLFMVIWTKKKNFWIDLIMGIPTEGKKKTKYFILETMLRNVGSILIALVFHLNSMAGKKKL